MKKMINGKEFDLNPEQCERVDGIIKMRDALYYSRPVNESDPDSCHNCMHSQVFPILGGGKITCDKEENEPLLYSDSFLCNGHKRKE